jgi:predicted lipoprotein with Yx(FWY)xxD motif
MKRMHVLLTALFIGAAGAGTTASAQAPPTAAHAARAAKVQLRRTSLGKILVSASGFTLYRFTRDPRNKDTCVMISECPQTWPALTTSARPIAGAGVKSSLLSTITLPDGRKQVTYAGHPLYLYASASERAETSYVGVRNFGGTWDAVNAAGKLVK